MTRKRLVAILTVLVCLAGLVLFALWLIQKSGNSGAYEMTGQITRIASNIAIVEGEVDGTRKIVNIKLNEQTKYNKAVLVATKEQLASKSQFVPRRELAGGSREDLKNGLNVVVRTKEDILSQQTVTATSVDYVDPQLKIE